MSDPNDNVLERNKAAVRRYNREVIEQGSLTASAELMDPEFVNRSAPPGLPSGADGMLYVFNQLLRPGLPDLRVEIHEQVAEGDLVTTRKTLHGTHRGTLLGVAATNRPVAIQVIDIVRLRHGRYLEHWGSNDLPSVLAALSAG